MGSLLGQVAGRAAGAAAAVGPTLGTLAKGAGAAGSTLGTLGKGALAGATGIGGTAATMGTWGKVGATLGTIAAMKSPALTGIKTGVGWAGAKKAFQQSPWQQASYEPPGLSPGALGGTAQPSIMDLILRLAQSYYSQKR